MKEDRNVHVHDLDNETKRRDHAAATYMSMALRSIGEITDLISIVQIEF